MVFIWLLILPGNSLLWMWLWIFLFNKRWDDSFLFFSPWHNSPIGPRPPHYRGFMITLGHNTLSRNSLDEWSARCWDLYLTEHNTHRRQTSITPAGFEPTIQASELPQTHALDRSATEIGIPLVYITHYKFQGVRIYLAFLIINTRKFCLIVERFKCHSFHTIWIAKRILTIEAFE